MLMRSLHLVVGRIVAESQQNPLVRYNLFPLIFGWHILTNSLDDRREKRGGEGRGRKRRQKGKGRGRRGSPLTSLPNPFSLFLSLSQSPTSSLPPLLRMLAWREEFVCRPLVKGNEDAGYEGSPFASHFDAFDAGWSGVKNMHTYLPGLLFWKECFWRFSSEPNETWIMKN